MLRIRRSSGFSRQINALANALARVVFMPPLSKLPHLSQLIRLYAPSDAPRLYTSGKLIRIHPNGRINYSNDVTAADGRTVLEVRAAALSRAKRGQQQAEKELAEAEAAATIGSTDGAPLKDDRTNGSIAGGGGPAAVGGSSLRIARAEMALDAAMERVASLSARRTRQRIDYGAGGDTPVGNAGPITGQVPLSAPPSFSRMPARTTLEEITNRFQRAERALAAEVEMHEGEMLYLPCGWFHEVCWPSLRPSHL
eukprot:scaffold273461_cov29-Tisochrysis_lutea.AAC.3